MTNDPNHMNKRRYFSRIFEAKKNRGNYSSVFIVCERVPKGGGKRRGSKEGVEKEREKERNKRKKWISSLVLGWVCTNLLGGILKVSLATLIAFEKGT